MVHTYVLFCLAKSTFLVMNDPTIWRGPGHENVYPSFLIELLASITFIKFSSALLASFDLWLAILNSTRLVFILNIRNWENFKIFSWVFRLTSKLNLSDRQQYLNGSIIAIMPLVVIKLVSQLKTSRLLLSASISPQAKNKVNRMTKYESMKKRRGRYLWRLHHLLLYLQ